MYRIIGVLGLAIGVAPFLLGYSDNFTALWTSLGLGTIAILASLIEAAEEDKGKWEYWVAGFAGIAAIAAPFLLGFGTISAALWTSVSVGALLFVLSGTKLMYRQDGLK